MRDRFLLIEPLRFIAAIAVLLYHYTFRGAAADNLTTVTFPELWPLSKYGCLGVQLFFVISGFVIAFSAQHRTASSFLIARVIRVYPVFLVCMTLSSIVLAVADTPMFHVSFQQWLANLVILSPAFGQPFVDGVYWSIIYELVFYGWVATLIALGLFQRYLRSALIAWLVLSVLNEAGPASRSVRLLFLTDASGLFAAGVLIHRLRTTFQRPSDWALLAVTTIVGAWQTTLFVDWARLHYRTEFSNTVIVILVCCSVAAVGGAAYVRGRSLKGASLLLALGSLTYPLYLLHQNVGYIALNWLSSVHGALSALLIVISSMILLAWAIRRFIERPAQRFLKNLVEEGTSNWELLRRNVAEKS